jgi:thiamine kinase-like enzyme
LLHFDVRSDNVCFAGDRAVLVDWNWAAIGNPVMDVAARLPSLHAEGGPPPEEISSASLRPRR